MQALSQAKAKQIRLLHQKKHREQESAFLVEGAKAVVETLKSDWEVLLIVGTLKFYESHKTQIERHLDIFFLTNSEVLGQISTLQTNEAALCVVRIPKPPAAANPKAPLWLAVEEIRDPGNLGTIIRLADWFGLSQLLCVGDCVEWFNPKVVSSSMGSFLRVHPVSVTYENLIDKEDRPLLAAHMEGKSLYQFTFPQKSTLVIGNEANGISEKVHLNALPVCIPRFGPAESLNAAMATGILLNQWRFGLHTK